MLSNLHLDSPKSSHCDAASSAIHSIAEPYEDPAPVSIKSIEVSILDGTVSFVHPPDFHVHSAVAALEDAGFELLKQQLTPAQVAIPAALESSWTSALEFVHLTSRRRKLKKDRHLATCKACQVGLHHDASSKKSKLASAALTETQLYFKEPQSM